MIKIVEELVKYIPLWLPWATVGLSAAAYLIATIFGGLFAAYKEIVKIGSIVVFALGFYLMGAQGYFLEDQAIQKVVIQKEIEYRDKIVDHQVVVTNTVVKYLKQKQQTIGTNYANIESKINTKDDAMCVIPNSFVSVHNAAATSLDTVSNTASGIDGASTTSAAPSDPSGISLSTVEQVVTTNYETYAKVAAKLVAAQNWINQQRVLMPNVDKYTTP